jgi:large subunit ribosomal protein L32
MSEPKKKTSHSSKGKRRSHLAIDGPTLDVCPNCKSPKLAHRVCPTCGMYNGRQARTITTGKKK